MPSPSSARDYDVLLYGAGGFTGRQTVAYLTSHAPTGLRWAIAGPRRHTLEAARAAAGAPLSDADVIVAPSQDQLAVDAIVSRARVVLNTAGPFALYGTPVVDACVRFGTHYVDITGETPWMREIANRYHAAAADRGTRIIPCCGFDSVPSDLGAMLMTRHVNETMQTPCTEVRAAYQISGGLNGGTVASLLNMLDAPREPGSAANRERRDERIRAVNRPQFDAQLGTWIGPFVMAPTNTAVVRRSMMLAEQFGDSLSSRFVYQEAMRYDAPFARAKAFAGTAALGLTLAALKNRMSRRVFQPLLPKPGAGPSTATMNSGWFRCELLGTAADGRVVRGLIAYDGDPGNRATTTFICESALALAIDGDTLPGGSTRGGVLTPATGLGEALVRRLRGAGTTMEFPSR